MTADTIEIDFSIERYIGPTDESGAPHSAILERLVNRRAELEIAAGDVDADEEWDVVLVGAGGLETPLGTLRSSGEGSWNTASLKKTVDITRFAFPKQPGATFNSASPPYLATTPLPARNVLRIQRRKKGVDFEENLRTLAVRSIALRFHQPAPPTILVAQPGSRVEEALPALFQRQSGGDFRVFGGPTAPPLPTARLSDETDGGRLFSVLRNGGFVFHSTMAMHEGTVATRAVDFGERLDAVMRSFGLRRFPQRSLLPRFSIVAEKAAAFPVVEHLRRTAPTARKEALERLLTINSPHRGYPASGAFVTGLGGGRVPSQAYETDRDLATVLDVDFSLEAIFDERAQPATFEPSVNLAALLAAEDLGPRSAAVLRHLESMRNLRAYAPSAQAYSVATSDMPEDSQCEGGLRALERRAEAVFSENLGAVIDPARAYFDSAHSQLAFLNDFFPFRNPGSYVPVPFPSAVDMISLRSSFARWRERAEERRSAARWFTARVGAVRIVRQGSRETLDVERCEEDVDMCVADGVVANRQSIGVGVATAVLIRAAAGVNHRQAFRSNTALIPVMTFLYPHVQVAPDQYLRELIQVPEGARMLVPGDYRTALTQVPLWPDRVVDNVDCLGSVDYDSLRVDLAFEMMSMGVSKWISARNAGVRATKRQVNVHTAKSLRRASGEASIRDSITDASVDGVLNTIQFLREQQLVQQVDQLRNPVPVLEVAR
jgi:hypothetical protein